jgi:hypothetical protein
LFVAELHFPSLSCEAPSARAGFLILIEDIYVNVHLVNRGWNWLVTKMHDCGENVAVGACHPGGTADHGFTSVGRLGPRSPKIVWALAKTACVGRQPLDPSRYVDAAECVSAQSSFGPMAPTRACRSVAAWFSAAPQLPGQL